MSGCCLLEKSLAPDARVRHNVKLKNLKTGDEEQCDVVVETGREPRVTRTIVEVQKRNRAVEANTFRGWLVKMDDVGASHLICVSAKPFPKSIKNTVAREYGPRVLLIRLEALEAKQWPFQIVNNSIKVTKSKVDVDNSTYPNPNPLLIFDAAINPFKEHIGQLLNSLSLPQAIRREGQDELLPMTDLINEGVRLMNKRPDLIRLPEGVSQVPVSWNPKGVWFCHEGKTAPIQEVRVIFKVETKSVLFPLGVSSYTPEGHGTSAWVVRATGQVDGEEAEIRFTCLPTTDGCFTMTRPQLLGIKEGGFFFWGYAPDNQPQPPTEVRPLPLGLRYPLFFLRGPAGDYAIPLTNGTIQAPATPLFSSSEAADTFRTNKPATDYTPRPIPDEPTLVRFLQHLLTNNVVLLMLNPAGAEGNVETVTVGEILNSMTS